MPEPTPTPAECPFDGAKLSAIVAELGKPTRYVHKSGAEHTDLLPALRELDVPTPTPDTGARVHELKTWPNDWLAVESGAKNFEVRRNDRGFQPGDTLVLREWNPDDQTYTSRSVTRRVDYVLRDAEQFGLQPGFVVLGLSTVLSVAGTATPDNDPAAEAEWTARRSHYGLPRTIYAAAHDVLPEDVDRTDRNYQRVHRLIMDNDQDYINALVSAAGLPEGTEYEQLVEWIETKAGRKLFP